MSKFQFAKTGKALAKGNSSEVATIGGLSAALIATYIIPPMLLIDVVWNWLGLHTLVGMTTISLWHLFLASIAANVVWRFYRKLTKA